MTKNTNQLDLFPNVQAVPGNLISGLERAEQIIEGRRDLAKALASPMLTYHPAYFAALDDVLIFIRAELYRQHNPDDHSGDTVLD